MTTSKVSLTLDEDLVSEARARVGHRGLSSYLNSALRRQLQHDRLGVLLAELDAEAGPVAPAVLEEVRREWPADEPPAMPLQP